MTAYDVVGFAALAVLWVGIAGLILLGVVVAVHDQGHADSIARHEAAMQRLARAHRDVMAETRRHPGPGRHQRRGEYRRSIPTG